jgi:hypothetical protein
MGGEEGRGQLLLGIASREARGGAACPSSAGAACRFLVGTSRVRSFSSERLRTPAPHPPPSDAATVLGREGDDGKPGDAPPLLLSPLSLSRFLSFFLSLFLSLFPPLPSSSFSHRFLTVLSLSRKRL